VLVAGERPVVLCMAPSQKQAGVVFGYVGGILESTPLLSGLIKSRSSDSLTLTNGIEIEVRAASFRNLRGMTAIAVVGDEAAFWYDEQSGAMNTDSAILDAVRPSLATTGGLLAVITTPHARRGETFASFSRHYGAQGDIRILVAQGASRDLNPSLPQSVVDRAMERDPVAARAEWLAQFRADLERFLSLEAVQACVDPGVFERAPAAWGVAYVGFVDPSGGSADSFAAAVAHREDDRLVLDAVREIKPPFSPEAATRELAGFFKSYGLSRISGDRYAGMWPREAFLKHNVSYETAERDASGLYLELLPAINSRRVALLDNPRLVSQLASLERRAAPFGRDRIDHPPNAHDDVANAVAGAFALLSASTTGAAWVSFYGALARRAPRPQYDSADDPLPWRGPSPSPVAAGNRLTELYRLTLADSSRSLDVAPNNCSRCRQEIAPGATVVSDGFQSFHLECRPN
jgi:hypothetical protein